METQNNILKILLGFLIVSILAFIVSLNWMGCKTENVIEPPSTIPVSQIATEIANANTQEKAIIAINNTIKKIGIGMNIEGSNYVNFTFENSFLMDLADVHSKYINENRNVSLDSVYNSLLSFSLRISNSYGSNTNLPQNINEIFLRLRQKANLAFDSMEDPNNVILMLIYADNGIIPLQFELYNNQTIKSPIQALLFIIWVIIEFQDQLVITSDCGGHTGHCMNRAQAVYSEYRGLGYSEEYCSTAEQNAFDSCCEHFQGQGGN